MILISDYGKKVKPVEAIAYYQIVNGLEVTGWITEETYNYVLKTEILRTEITKYMSNAKNLSAEELIDLIGSGVKYIQENKSNKEACDNVYMQIEVLVNYLKQTLEYLSNRNLKDVDWIFKVGENTPGFKDIVDAAFTKENIYSNDNKISFSKDYLEQYNEQYVANTLTVIDGVLIISVGGAVVYEVATTGGVVLTIGSTVVPVAGYSATQWEQAVHHAVNNIDYNRANNHIMQSKHLWSNIVNNPTWDKISIYVQKVLLYGEKVDLKHGYVGKQMIIDGNMIQVQYNIIDGTLKIVNAWVVK